MLNDRSDRPGQDPDFTTEMPQTVRSSSIALESAIAGRVYLTVHEPPRRSPAAFTILLHFDLRSIFGFGIHSGSSRRPVEPTLHVSCPPHPLPHRARRLPLRSGERERGRSRASRQPHGALPLAADLRAQARVGAFARAGPDLGGAALVGRGGATHRVAGIGARARGGGARGPAHLAGGLALPVAHAARPRPGALRRSRRGDPRGALGAHPDRRAGGGAREGLPGDGRARAAVRVAEESAPCDAARALRRAPASPRGVVPGRVRAGDVRGVDGGGAGDAGWTGGGGG